ncbi:unnamed protein product [Cuscuta campestris]|uniref:Reverse transcriptase domain-containing protein n=1 Tax=Cuscuta campestris TaxID=132261 RepID=A0A484N4G4_9ASTE|nr:unnamed protein product [Cuscuta campestris]
METTQKKKIFSGIKNFLLRKLTRPSKRKERFPFTVKARYKRDTTPEEIGKSLEKGGFKGGFRISRVTRYQVLGKPIKLDETTARGGYYQTARVLVEMDVSKPKLSSIKVTSNYWVRNITVVYDQPLYCKSCKRWGHCCTNPSTAGRVLTGGELQTGDKTTNRGSFEWTRVERNGKKLMHVNTRKREPTRLQTSNKFQALVDENSADTMVGDGPSSIFQPSVIPKAVTSLEAGPSTGKVGIINDKIPLQTLGSISPGNPTSLLVKQTALKHTSTLDSLGLLSTYADPETPCTPVCIHSDGEEMNSFKLKLGITHAASFLHNQLWIFWMEPTLTLLQTVELEQVVHCHFNSPTSPGPIWISSIYGKHSRSSRKTFWESISKCNPRTQPWILGGDFNCIHNIDEHKGNTEPCHNPIEDFRNCMEANNLLYLPPSGGHFSWSGSRSSGKVWRRLDHIYCTQPVLDQFPTLSLEMLSKGSSDHRPLLLKYSLSSFSGHKPFKFLNMWTSHHSLEATIRSFWERNKTFNGMQGLANKLKALKPILIKWNGEVFGNIFQKLKDAEASAQTTQTFYEANPSPDSLVAANKANAELVLITKREAEFWQQKAGIKWIKEGDTNSKFFHNLVKGKRLRLHISSIKNDEGKILEDKTEVATFTVNFFTKLYKADSVSGDPHIFSFIPKLINDEDNKLICTLPLGEEVKKAVWDLNESSALGPDGYNGVFLKTFWHIIQQEVIRASQEFFLGLPVPKSYGATLLTLIPKEDNPKSLGDYRPISLSNFISKINTKILSNRLRNLLPKVISPEQSGFQAGKGIDENRGSANVAIKADLSKAFDRLS